MPLSERLQLVFDQLLPNEDVWDFCCDHGYLGGAAYKSQHFKNIYFVDPVPAIMQDLEMRFQKYVFAADNKSKAYFLNVKGQNLAQVVTGTACLIGVGGLLIYEILEALNQNHFLKAQRLVLGPQRDAQKLLDLISRAPLLNYRFIERKVVIENHREREFFIFELRSSHVKVPS